MRSEEGPVGDRRRLGLNKEESETCREVMEQDRPKVADKDADARVGR
jgi:hypothetical protein